MARSHLVDTLVEEKIFCRTTKKKFQDYISFLFFFSFFHEHIDIELPITYWFDGSLICITLCIWIVIGFDGWTWEKNFNNKITIGLISMSDSSLAIIVFCRNDCLSITIRRNCFFLVVVLSAIDIEYCQSNYNCRYYLKNVDRFLDIFLSILHSIILFEILKYFVKILIILSSIFSDKLVVIRLTNENVAENTNTMFMSFH